MKKKDWMWVDWLKVGAIFVVGACVGLALAAVLDLWNGVSGWSFRGWF